MNKINDDYKRYIRSKTEKVISGVFISSALIIFLVNVVYIYSESFPSGDPLISAAVFPTLLFVKYIITSYAFWLHSKKIKVDLVLSTVALGLISIISWYIL